MPMTFEQKHPADLVARRVMCIARSLAASAVAVAAVVVTPAAFIAVTVVPAIIPIVVMPLVARGGVNHRPAHWRSRPMDNHRRTGDHGQWAGRHINRRGTHHRDRQAEDEVHRQARVGGSGEPTNGNHSYQTEQMFCFHGGFDGGPAAVFDNPPLIKMKEH
jgi:hypothetical protein